jgi:peptidoglycan hydrolase-like protein with peptidoglycan-binding domain
MFSSSKNNITILAVLAFIFSNTFFAQTVTAVVTTDANSCLRVTSNIGPESKGEDVKKIQTFLKSQGLFGYTVSGVFSAKTQSAVRQFQAKKLSGVNVEDVDQLLIPNVSLRQSIADKGFVVKSTGVIDEQTRAKILYVTCKKVTANTAQTSSSPAKASTFSTSPSSSNLNTSTPWLYGYYYLDYSASNNDLDDLDLDGISNDIDKCPGTIPSSTINTLGCPLPRWTNFVNQSTDISRKNINKIYNFELKNNKGAIQFNESISLILNNNSIDLDSNIIIEQNKISIDTSKLSQFNKSAKLIFYNITSINPKVLRNGISCTDCKIISFENKVLTVEVPHFTTYEIIENSTILSDNSQNISNNDSIAPETTNPGNIEDTEDYLNSEIPLQQANEDDSDKLNISSEIKATKIKSSKIWIFLLIAIIILLIMGFIIFKILNKTDQKNKSTLTSSKQDKLQQ